MEETLKQVAHTASLGIQFLALLVIVLGTIEAVVGIVRVIVTRGATGNSKRGVWLDYSHWLVAGLTFQLAADIIETMVVPGWTDLARVAIIAVIRTFLTFFLDRDIDAVRERRTKGGDHAAGA